MAPLLYSKAATKKLVPEVIKNAPKAPTCPVKLKISEIKLKIQYKPGQENGCGVVFERQYVEHRITKEIESFSIADHHEDLEHARSVFLRTMTTVFNDSQTYLTGSYGGGVEIENSDLDFAVSIPSLAELTPFGQLMEMKKQLRRFENFERVHVQKAYTPVLKLVHRETKKSIDVTVDDGTSKRNTQLLSWYGQLDSRFPLLCKAMKSWASKVGVEGSKRARLNSFSMCLMLIHYLQVIGVLPNLQEIFPELNEEFLVENDKYQERNLKEKIIEKGKFKFDENKSSLAALFLGFLRYYAEFDFRNNWISVKHGRVMKKRWDENKKPLDGMPDNCWYIVVVDPFLKVPRNCAGTVRQTDYVERIQFEFQQEYDRILSKRTIFNMGPCNWSRRITRRGEKRDLQIRKEVYPLWKEICDKVPWGTTTITEHLPYLPDPEIYWNLEIRKTRQYERTEAWPELYGGYDLCDSYIT